MELYEHKQRFTVKTREVDFNDEMRVSTALSFMEEVACSSADELGFGYGFIKPRGYAFMVSGIVCEFLRPIALGETIEAITWPLPPSHVIFGREYRLCDKEGKDAVVASSRWCLIDMNTGKILPSKTIEGQDYSTYNTTRALENANWKIPSFLPEEGEKRYEITVANSDYDHNMHVNNTRYADYCLNCFSVRELSENRVKKFSISYIKQCKENDRLCFYRKKQEDGSYLLHGFNEAGEAVTKAHVAFEKIGN